MGDIGEPTKPGIAIPIPNFIFVSLFVLLVYISNPNP
jgi:hypothetical protein